MEGESENDLMGIVLLRAIHHNDEATIEQYLSSEICSPHMKLSDGLQIIHIAALRGRLEILKLLICYGAEPSAKCIYGLTPLHYAILSRDHDIISFLADIGVDINDASSSDLTPLHIAVAHGFYDTAKHLLKYNALVNPPAQSNKGREPPIFLAACNFDIRMTDLLLEHGANIHAIGTAGMNLIHRALNGLRRENAEMKKHLPMLKIKCRRKLLPYIKYLVSKGVNINHVDENGMTILATACKNGHVQCVNYLLEMGLDINTPDSSNTTPLQHALSQGHYKIMKLCVKYKSDVTLLTTEGISVLHLCARKGDDSTMAELLKQLKDRQDIIDGANALGETPLHLACRYGTAPIVESLIKAGANVNNTSYYGCTPAITTCIIDWRELDSANAPWRLKNKINRFETRGVIYSDGEDEDEDDDYINPPLFEIFPPTPEEKERQEKYLNSTCHRTDLLKESGNLMKKAIAFNYAYGDNPEDCQRGRNGIIDYDEDDGTDKESGSESVLAEEEDYEGTNEQGKKSEKAMEEGSEERILNDEKAAEIQSEEEFQKRFEERYGDILAIPTDPYYSEEYRALAKGLTHSQIINSHRVTSLRFRKLEAQDKRRTEIMKVLIKYGADLSITHPDKEPILSIATTYCLYDLVKLLIENNVPVNLRARASWRQFSPLDIACYHNNHRLMKLLLDNGARLSKADKLEHSHLLNVTSPSALKRIIENGDFNVNYFGSWGYPVKIPNSRLLKRHRNSKENQSNSSFYDFITPLLSFIRDKNTPMVLMLLEHDADPNFESSIGSTALHEAVSTGDLELVKLILPLCKFFLEHQDVKGLTPVLIAAERGFLSVAKLLCETGANLVIRCNQGRNVLHYSAMLGDDQCTKYFYERCPENLEVYDNDELTPLQLCVSKRNTEKNVAYLMSLPNVEPYKKNNQGLSAVDIAVKRGNESTVACLTKKPRNT